jgi:hypothetical protein
MEFERDGKGEIWETHEREPDEPKVRSEVRSPAKLEMQFLAA